MEIKEIYLIIKNDKNYLKKFTSLQELDEFFKDFETEEEFLKYYNFKSDSAVLAYYVDTSKINFIDLIYKYDNNIDINHCLNEIDAIINAVDLTLKDKTSYNENDLKTYLYFLHKKKYILSLEEKNYLKKYIISRNSKYKKSFLACLKRRFLANQELIILRRRTYSSRLLDTSTKKIKSKKKIK